MSARDPGAERPLPDDDDRRARHDDRRVDALPPDVKAMVIRRVATFTEFTPENDPHSEHDFGSFALAGRKFFWKIDYFDAAMEFGSEDPADPSKTTRACSPSCSRRSTDGGASATSIPAARRRLLIVKVLPDGGRGIPRDGFDARRSGEAVLHLHRRARV